MRWMFNRRFQTGQKLNASAKRQTTQKVGAEAKKSYNYYILGLLEHFTRLTLV